jgi:hypothetical protein
VTSPQIRKFIVGFLLLAILTGSAFAASLYRGSLNGGQAEGAAQINRAFAPALAGGTRDAELAAIEAMEATGATNDIATIFTDEITKKNPDGPSETNGKTNIVIPGGLDATLAAYVATHQFSESAIAPEVSDKDIIRDDQSDAAAFNRYFAAIADVIGSVRQDQSGATDPSILINNIDLIQDGARRIAQIKTPAALVDFQKNLIATVQISAKYGRLVVADPLTASALSGNYNLRLSANLDAMTKELATLSVQKQLSIPQVPRSITQRLLGIQTAYALFGVGDIVFDPAALTQMIKEFFQYLKDHWKGILTEALKSALLRLLSTQVTNWVNNHGVPQFVTNWNTFLSGAANIAANQTLKTQYSKLCKSLGGSADILAKVLQAGTSGSIVPSGGCTSGGAILNIKDFNSDFRNGGWTSYVKALQPQNNFLGALTNAANAQSLAATAAAEIAKSRALAGSGFPGTEVCDDGKAPSPGDGCADGKPSHVSTPGKTISDILSKSFTSGYDRILAADSAQGNGYQALANFLATAAINQLLKSGLKGLGGGSSTNPNAPTAPAPEDPAGDVAGELQQILARKQSSLDDARSTLSVLTDTVGTLRQVVNACSANPNIVTDAAAEIEALILFQDDLTAKIEQLKPQIEALQTFSGSLEELHSKFGTVAQAQTEAEDLASKRANADSVFTQAGNLFSSCSADVINTPIDTGPGDNSTTTPSEP